MGNGGGSRSGRSGQGRARQRVRHSETTRVQVRAPGSDYVVEHYRQQGGDIPAGAWVYARPASGGGYRIHLDRVGHAGAISALSGSETPAQLHLAVGTRYSVVWSTSELAPAALDTALGQSTNQFTPSSSDAAARQLLAPRSAAEGYAVHHFRQREDGADLPSTPVVYVRAAAGGTTYRVSVQRGAPTQVRALGGGVQPELRVAVGTQYAAVWATAELEQRAIDQAFGDAGNRVTPSQADADAQQLLLPLAPLRITTQTLAFSPADQTRRTIGVGEQVNLDLTGSSPTTPATWTKTGGELNQATGNHVIFTAPALPATVTVTVTQGARSEHVEFHVIAPTHTKMRIITPYTLGPHETFEDAREHIANTPTSGFHADVFVFPDTVNFGALEWGEDEIAVNGTGNFHKPQPEGHHPHVGGLPVGDVVTAGLGTGGRLIDHVYSGFNTALSGYMNSRRMLPIPHRYRVGPGGVWSQPYYTANQLHTVEVSGDALIQLVTLHSEKADATARVDLDPNAADLPAH